MVEPRSTIELANDEQGDTHRDENTSRRVWCEQLGILEIDIGVDILFRFCVLA